MQSSSSIFALWILFCNSYVASALHLGVVNRIPESVEDVFIFAGQSNCVGMTSSANLTGRYTNDPPSMMMWPPEHHWGHFNHLRFPSFGPEVSFGHEVADALYAQSGKNFGLLKVARSATSLQTDWSLENWRERVTSLNRVRAQRLEDLLYSNVSCSVEDELGLSDGDASGAQPLFPLLVREGRAALSASECKSGRCRLRAFVWVQGEKDSRSKESGEAYESLLSDFVAAVREAFDEPNLLVIIAGLSPELAARVGGGQQLIQSQQNFVAKDGHAAFVDTLDIPKRWDRLHYTEDGLHELGRRIAAAYLKAQE